MICDLNVFIKNKTTTDFMLYKANLLAPDWIMRRRAISHWCLGENRRTFISLSYTEKKKADGGYMFNHFLLHDSADVRSCTKVFQHCIKGRMKKKKPKKDKTCIFTINASLLPLIHYVHISLVYYDSSYRMKPLHALHFSSTGNYSAFKRKKGLVGLHSLNRTINQG